MKPGERIKDFREEKGLTQKDFSKGLGVSQSFLAQVESGVREPSRSLLVRLTRTYGVSSDYVLYGSEEEQRKYLAVREAEVPYEVLPTSTKKLLDSVKEILESDNEVMIDALKSNIKAFLQAVREKKNNKNSEGGAKDDSN